MNPRDGFHALVSGPTGTKLILETSARYRKSSRYNGDTVFVRLRHRTTGHGHSIGLDPAKVRNLALALRSSGTDRHHWVKTGQNALDLNGGTGFRISHSSSYDGTGPWQRRTAELEPEVGEALAEWLEKWLAEGWS